MVLADDALQRHIWVSEHDCSCSKSTDSGEKDAPTHERDPVEVVVFPETSDELGSGEDTLLAGGVDATAVEKAELEP